MYKIATYELEAKMASGGEVETIFRCIQETKESQNGKNHTKPKRERLVFNLPGIARRVVRRGGMRMAGVCCQR
jgi:hypothetical protein